MRCLVLTTCALAMACSPAADRTQPDADARATPAAEPATTATTLPAPASLVGEYRVAGIDGEALDAPVGIAVSITRDTISYEPRCLGFAWTYRYDRGAIALARDPRHGPERNADGGTVSCLPAVSPEFGRLAGALSVAEKVERTPENGLRFSGAGRSATLFSQ